MYQIHLILPYIGNSKVWRLNNLMVWKVFTVSHMYQVVPPSTRWPLSPANLAQNSPGNYQVVLGGIKFQVNYTNLWKTLAHLRVTPAAAVVSSVGHTLLDTGAFRIATLGITGLPIQSVQSVVGYLPYLAAKHILSTHVNRVGGRYEAGVPIIGQDCKLGPCS